MGNRFAVCVFPLVALALGCSGQNRISVAVPPEAIDDRIELAIAISEAHDSEETGAFGPDFLKRLEEAAETISSNPSDIENYKSCLDELKKVKQDDFEKIAALTAKLAGCLEIPEKFQTPLVRENRKQ